MYSRHALIVDDSKTAQFRLKRMLEVYELEVDIAGSAEEALAYLSYRVPAVIFLDQSMEGMNGIEALRTIKANPNTATIPVIMYTSEKGEVFTSQARALGALDVLNKGSLAPSSLDKMLRTLKIPARKKAKDPETTAESETSINVTAATVVTKNPKYVERYELEEIQRQIARLFEIHIADVGRQISKSTQFLSKRLHAQAENTNKPPSEIVVDDVPLDVINREVSAERRRMALVSNGLLAIVFFGLVVLGAMLFNMFGRLADLSNNYSNALAMAESNAKQISRINNDLSYANTTGHTSVSVNRQMLGTLTWIANTDFSFGLDEEPLGENMIPRLQQLTYQLADIGYEGLVEININFGNTCLVRANNGEFSIAPNSLSVFDCTLRSAVEQEFAIDNYLTLPYLNFEQSSQVLREHRIALAVNTVGMNNPRTAYPYLSNDITAADWNRISAQNNYLSFVFHPYE